MLSTPKIVDDSRFPLDADHLGLIDDNVKSGDWGIGVHGATVEAVHAIQQGKVPAPTVG